jgi:hypothetical protein
LGLARHRRSAHSWRGKTMSSKSRVPQDLTDEAAHKNFLDALDRRQLRLGQLSDVTAGSVTLPELAALVNEILATHRTK